VVSLRPRASEGSRTSLLVFREITSWKRVGGKQDLLFQRLAASTLKLLALAFVMCRVTRSNHLRG